MKDKIKSWDNRWEGIFSSHEWGRYPSEDLVRFVARNFCKLTERKQIKFLDLGCGTGNNSWYLAREGFSVYGVDGSKTAISKAQERFRVEMLRANFRVMDYISLDFPKNYFNVVIDICSIQHNHIENIRLILEEIRRVLKPNGKFFSMMVSKGTYSGPYENKGYVHFYSMPEVRKLYKPFRRVTIEKSERTMNNMKNRIIHWIVSGSK